MHLTELIRIRGDALGPSSVEHLSAGEGIPRARLDRSRSSFNGVHETFPIHRSDDTAMNVSRSLRYVSIRCIRYVFANLSLNPVVALVLESLLFGSLLLSL